NALVFTDYRGGAFRLEMTRTRGGSGFSKKIRLRDGVASGSPPTKPFPRPNAIGLSSAAFYVVFPARGAAETKLNEWAWDCLQDQSHGAAMEMSGVGDAIQATYTYVDTDSPTSIQSITYVDHGGANGGKIGLGSGLAWDHGTALFSVWGENDTDFQ